MSELTRIHAVLTTLTPLLEAAVPDGATARERVVVWDGPRLGEWPWQVVVLGLSQDNGGTNAYTCRYTRQDGLGAPRYLEHFAIRTFVSVSLAADDAAPQARARVVEILDSIDAALRANPVVQGVWDDIGVGDTDIEWQMAPGEDFGTNVSAFVSIEGSAIL